MCGVIQGTFWDSAIQASYIRPSSDPYDLLIFVRIRLYLPWGQI